MRGSIVTPLAIANVLWAGPALAQAPTLGEALTSGKPILEMRARYEKVDQAGLAEDAAASTLRTRLGYQTGAWNHLEALVELENVVRLAPERYNVAVPGPGGRSLNHKTAFPIVDDPQVTELNRAQLTWAPDKAWAITIGRQRILLDDQRFVGNVGWRQDEQTFDAARVDFATGPFRATYAYVGRVNRIFGQRLDWRGDIQILNASYALAPDLTLTAFDYAEAFDNAAANSNNTWGVRAAGKARTGPVGWAWTASYANERAYRNNPARFDLDYYEADLTAVLGAYALRAGYEQLNGDDTHGFFTPLGTTHGFEGWADAFAVAGGAKTHLDGIEDASLTATWRPPLKARHFSNLVLTAAFHDFDAELTRAHLADEWDVQATVALTPRLSGLIKYADYNRDQHVPAGVVLAPPDRTKFWVAVEFKL